MFEDIQFVTDADGNRTAVIITNEDYEELLASQDEVIREANPQQSVEVSRAELSAVLASALATGLELPGDQQAAIQSEAG